MITDTSISLSHMLHWILLMNLCGPLQECKLMKIIRDLTSVAQFKLVALCNKNPKIQKTTKVCTSQC